MASRLTKKQWQRKKRIKVVIIVGIITLIGTVIMSLLCIMLGSLFGKKTKQIESVPIEEMFLTPNQYSRPQDPLVEIKGIVIHYTANPGADAMANRNYFENLKDTHETSASSHFIVGLDGVIVQCIPLDEIAYASNKRNEDTISIECCHSDESGKFTKETYDSLIKLTAWLCGQYNLKEEDIIRHYDVTGKDCPRYYVKHEDLWEQLKTDVFTYIDENAVIENKR
jgi:N-acetylmuramoyl-L-alanine amidase